VIVNTTLTEYIALISLPVSHGYLSVKQLAWSRDCRRRYVVTRQHTSLTAAACVKCTTSYWKRYTLGRFALHWQYFK